MPNLVTNFAQGVNEEWMHSETPIKGAAWARSKESVTQGIWLWKRHFKVRLRSGRQASGNNGILSMQGCQNPIGNNFRL